REAAQRKEVAVRRAAGEMDMAGEPEGRQGSQGELRRSEAGWRPGGDGRDLEGRLDRLRLRHGGATRGAGDEVARAGTRADLAAILEQVVGLEDRVGAQSAQAARAAHGGQAIARAQVARADAFRDLAGERGVAEAGLAG